MAGTTTGGKKAAETNKQTYGADYHKRLGSKGGSKTRDLGHLDKINFKAYPERARIAGAIGGRNGKPYSKHPERKKMAFVVLKTGKSVTMRHDQAMLLQQVIDGQVTPTPELQAKADKIKKIYFNKENFRTAINIPETSRLPYKDGHDA